MAATFEAVDVTIFHALEGIEIAGPSTIFQSGNQVPIYSVVEKLDDYSYARPTRWGGREINDGETYRYRANRAPGRQWVGDTTWMSAVPSQSYDFVAASHVFEHIANPLRAAREWLRVLKSTGLLLLVIPHRDGAHDRNRPITSLAHLIQDFERNVGEDDSTHYDEVRQLSTEQFSDEWWAECATHRGLHHHVFDTLSILDVFNHLGLAPLIVAPLMPHHIVLVGSKGERTEGKELSVSDIIPVLQASPFRSDRAAALNGRLPVRQ